MNMYIFKPTTNGKKITTRRPKEPLGDTLPGAVWIKNTSVRTSTHMHACTHTRTHTHMHAHAHTHTQVYILATHGICVPCTLTLPVLPVGARILPTVFSGSIRKLSASVQVSAGLSPGRGPLARHGPLRAIYQM